MYPFSKLRVILSLILGVTTFLLSLPIMFAIYGYSFFWVLVLMAMLVVTILLSVRAKFYVMEKMRKLAKEESRNEENGGYNIFLLILLIAIEIAIPVFSVFILGFEIWFLFFVSLTSGFLLSEPIVYYLSKNK